MFYCYHFDMGFQIVIIPEYVVSVLNKDEQFNESSEML